MRSPIGEKRLVVARKRCRSRPGMSRPDSPVCHLDSATFTRHDPASHRPSSKRGLGNGTDACLDCGTRSNRLGAARAWRVGSALLVADARAATRWLVRAARTGPVTTSQGSTPPETGTPSSASTSRRGLPRSRRIWSWTTSWATQRARESSHIVVPKASFAAGLRPSRASSDSCSPGRPYAMRHWYASFAIAAGLPTFEIATTMGTSLEQLSNTYAHLLPDSADRARFALDAYFGSDVARAAR